MLRAVARRNRSNSAALTALIGATRAPPGHN